MLQTIRDKISGWVAKLLLGALVVVFVFWGIELRSVSSTDNLAAKVNGDAITLSSLQSAWQQRQAELAQTFSGKIPDAVKKQQQDLLLTQMIRSQLMISRADDLGFHVSDADIASYIRELDILKTDGKFSREKYTSALIQQGMTEAQFEAQLRTDLETKQLQNGVYGTSFLTSRELSRARALFGEQREIDYLLLPLKSYLAKVQVSDSDVALWYDAHKAEYLTDESVTLQYVELKLADSAAQVQVDEAALREHYEQIKDRFASTERRKAHHILIAVSKDVDDAAAKKQADDVMGKLNAGGDFDALARQYSKDPGSASKGGDLGWATKGMFVPEFENALFAMKPGEVRGPIKTEFGYHIIRLDDIEGGAGKTFEQVRTEVEADYKAERARTLFYEKTQKLADEAFAKLTELDSVAKDFGVSVQSIANFTRKGAGEFAGNSQIIDAAFAEAVLDKGENSALITLGEDRALVLRVAGHQQPQQKPLELVKSEIVARLTAQSAKAALDKQSQELVAQLMSGARSWNTVNQGLSATLAGKKMLGRTAEGVDVQLLNAAFSLPKNAISAQTPAYTSVALDNGDHAVIMVSAVQPGGTGPEAAAEVQTLREQRVARLAASELSDYVRELERTAKIERNPNAFE